MPLSRNCLFFFSLVLLFVSPGIAQTTFRPKALVLPVQKDSLTLQYVTQINQRTPLVPVNVTLDLGGLFLWVDCEQGYVSSSYRPARCNSAQCSLINARRCSNEICLGSSPRPGCNNNTCSRFLDNRVISFGTEGEVGQDVVSVQSTDGSNPGILASVSNLLFTCARTFILEGLPNGVKGMAGLGRNRASLPSQFSSAFNFRNKFAVCLTSSSAKGVVFFGDGPYVLQPNFDVSKSLTYTPLLQNPLSTGSGFNPTESSSDYFIGVKSIKINEKTVSLNTTLLKINSEGSGGTMLSTVRPYTVMETTIYNAVLNAFVKELAHVPRVASVAPFGACFDASKIASTRLGPAVPSIDLMLQSNNVVWRIIGANSMVQVNRDVLCLGFVDGGVDARTSIIIGGHQLEDNFLQFDLAASRLGFSSSLLSRQTTCANFDFTSKA
ncbi:hypothetical protein JCGZ_02108 [Jatropha curcas]|uniref:Peptidase A1 domain-containing protein n=2 Tax=Jatropha curcas TaxID=180498 RepID=A0A067L6I6_JATCU|nr:hypothetical protein JCGZ_02108 [Jatropha curcas]